MKGNGASEKYSTNELHTMLYFAAFLGLVQLGCIMILLDNAEPTRASRVGTDWHN
jgi:hypothetical protein